MKQGEEPRFLCRHPPKRLYPSGLLYAQVVSLGQRESLGKRNLTVL